MNWKVLLSDIDFSNEEIKSVLKILKSKWLSMGPVTKEFEKNFAKYLKVKNAFAVSSGTAALHIAHAILGLKPGDEVIVPSLTFVATTNSILYTGAKPVFADITSFDDLNVSPEEIRRKVTNKTKAITVVHYGGYPCDIKSILEIANEHDLYIIEDAAHAPGAKFGGKKIGSIGDVGCFSFFSNKNLVTGEGGMVVTNDDSLSNKVRLMRSHGMASLTWDRYKGHLYAYDIVDLGYNYRVTEITSALGLAQLKKLERNNKKREKITREYRNLLKDIPQILIPFEKYFGVPSFHLFPILISKKISREKFMNHLKKAGIQTSIHYPPIHFFKFYRNRFGYKHGTLPKTEYVGAHEVTLPLHPLMTKGDVHFICQTIEKYFD
jgi:dTDP-4-amino-4,6-dideoxygalactose transaminase